MERTFIIIKPDAVQRGLIGEIIQRFERRGLKIVAMHLKQVDDSLARRHYAEHEGKGFFPGLVNFITSAPVVAMVVEGTNAVAQVRQMVGATKPGEAAPGTIRADYALEIGRNLVHASDKLETADREIALWFGDSLAGWQRATDSWVFEG